MPRLASGALVGEGGVDEAVEQDERSGGEQWGEALLDELGAGGGVQQCLGGRAERERGVGDERADAL